MADNSAGKPSTAIPIKVVSDSIVTNEAGRAVASVPIRYVNSALASDELGRPVDALQAVIVDGLTGVVEGRMMGALPVRVVAGTTTTDEVGKRVPVMPVWLSSGTPTPTPTPAAISSIYASGYRAAYVGTPSGYQPGDVLNLVRKGYDGSYTSPGGVPTPTLLSNIAEQAKVRHRCRNSTGGVATGYPDDSNEPVWGSDVALSTCIYSTDSVTGMSGANNSTVVSPKATAGWALYDRRVVGNSLRLQVVTYQRNGRNSQGVACVLFRATDGTNTVYKLVTTSSVLTMPSGHPFADVRVEGYEDVLDITSLNDSADITVNAKIFPWIGDAASVIDSADSALEYEFSPQIYRKNTARAANPPLAYVSSTGTDATVDANGVASGNTKVSTTAATARANPFLTITSALHALKAATAITGGFDDYCEVRLMDGISWSTNVTTGTYGQTCPVIITRDPLTANRAAAPLTLGTALNTRQNIGILFRDLKVVRTANVLLSGCTRAWWDGVDLDNGGYSGQPITSINYHCSVTVTNAAAGYFAPGSVQHPLIRGCSGIGNGEAGVFIGNKGISPLGSTTRQLTRSIVADNVISTAGASPAAFWNSSSTWNNTVLVGNVLENTGTASTFSWPHPSADSAAGSMKNFICHNNTWAGAYGAGRSNWLYDETIGTNREQDLHLNEANCFVSLSSKSDYFLGQNGGGDAAECAGHVKSQNILYGVDYNYLFCQWWDVGDVGLPSAMGYATLGQRWGHYSGYTYGENSSVPTSKVLNDAKFKDNKATTYNGTTYSAGAGGGDYRPQRISQGDAADSPLIGQVVVPKRRYDLRGAARASSNDTIGAYA